MRETFRSVSQERSWYEDRTSGHDAARPSKKRKRCPRTPACECVLISPPAASKVKDPR